MLVVMLKICRLEDQVKDKFAERIQKRGKIFENTKKLCGKYTKMLITLYTSDDILGKLKIQNENFLYFGFSLFEPIFRDQHAFFSLKDKKDEKMVEWFRNFESDLSSMNVENYMNAKKMEKSLNSLIQKHRFEAPVLVTIQVLAQIDRLILRFLRSMASSESEIPTRGLLMSLF